MAIDWDWPIEWHDGTPAWVSAGAHDNSSLVIMSSTKPDGVVVTRDRNLYSRLVDESDHPKLRNVDLPHIAFHEGSAPVGGSFKSASVIAFRHPNGAEWEYEWPRLKPLTGSPHITTRTKRQQAAFEEEQARKAAEAAVMEEDPLYGLF